MRWNPRHDGRYPQSPFVSSPITAVKPISTLRNPKDSEWPISNRTVHRSRASASHFLIIKFSNYQIIFLLSPHQRKNLCHTIITIVTTDTRKPNKTKSPDQFFLHWFVLFWRLSSFTSGRSNSILFTRILKRGIVYRLVFVFNVIGNLFFSHDFWFENRGMILFILHSKLSIIAKDELWSNRNPSILN